MGALRKAVGGTSFEPLSETAYNTFGKLAGGASFGEPASEFFRRHSAAPRLVETGRPHVALVGLVQLRASLERGHTAADEEAVALLESVLLEVERITQIIRSKNNL